MVVLMSELPDFMALLALIQSPSELLPAIIHLENRALLQKHHVAGTQTFGCTS
jgi:hypothetical protein